MLAALGRANHPADPAQLPGEPHPGAWVAPAATWRSTARRFPRDLVESALFGHEKGAFTGAVVEAQGGTLFLDEVGDLADAHQARLLRALDAHEILPVGGGARRIPARRPGPRILARRRGAIVTGV